MAGMFMIFLRAFLSAWGQFLSTFETSTSVSLWPWAGFLPQRFSTSAALLPPKLREYWMTVILTSKEIPFGWAILFTRPNEPGDGSSMTRIHQAGSFRSVG